MAKASCMIIYISYV